MLVTVVLH